MPESIGWAGAGDGGWTVRRTPADQERWGRRQSGFSRTERAASPARAAAARLREFVSTQAWWTLFLVLSLGIAVESGLLGARLLAGWAGSPWNPDVVSLTGVTAGFVLWASAWISYTHNALESAERLARLGQDGWDDGAQTMEVDFLEE